MLVLIKINLKRQDREQLIHIATDILDTVLFPCPYLGRDIVMNRYSQFGMNMFSYLQIETRIINKYDHIRIPLFYVAFTERHIFKNGSKMQKYGYKSHISHITIMLYTESPFRRHQVASEEAEIRLSVNLLQRVHQSGSMKVATCLTGNQIILHCFLFGAFLFS